MAPLKINLQARAKPITIHTKASSEKIKKRVEQIRESGKTIRQLKELVDVKKSLTNKKPYRTGPYKTI